MFMSLRRSIGCVSLLVIASIASAWNATGHAQVADIAWAKLTRASRVKVAKLFMVGDTVSRGDRVTEFTVPKVSDAEITDDFLETKVRPVFRRAASWCDDIKGGSSANYEERINSDNNASPGITAPEGDPLHARGEGARCKTWHYYDMAINAPGDSNEHPAKPSNAVRALGLVRGLFEKSTDAKERLYDLFWMEHLFGDLAQPLHCAESFVYSEKGDAGGNGFMTGAANEFRPDSKTNLHSYWDSGIDHAVSADSRLGARTAADKVTEAWLGDAAMQPSAAQVDDLDPMSWVKSGHDLAVKYVYGSLQPNAVPDDSYKKNQNELCEKQALLAGFRLAKYLNEKL
jgi:hypothetical protein